MRYNVKFNHPSMGCFEAELEDSNRILVKMERRAIRCCINRIIQKEGMNGGKFLLRLSNGNVLLTEDVESMTLCMTVHDYIFRMPEYVDIDDIKAVMKFPSDEEGIFKYRAEKNLVERIKIEYTDNGRVCFMNRHGCRETQQTRTSEYSWHDTLEDAKATLMAASKERVKELSNLIEEEFANMKKISDINHDNV